MRNYNANDIQQLFDAQANLAQFYIVAHKNICPAQLSAKTLQARVQTAKQDLRHTLNVLAAALHPNQSNCVRRKPHLYRPLTLTTIEAVNTAQASPEKVLYFDSGVATDSIRFIIPSYSRVQL